MTILNYEAFICEIKKQLQEKMGEEARIDIHDTVKNNGVTYKSISVLKKDCNVSPNLRLDDFYTMYREGRNIDRILEKIVKIFEKHTGNHIDIDSFTDFERAKDYIMFKLISYEENRERLQHMPHVRFLDLAVIYYYYMERGYVTGETASIQIETDYLKYWNLSEVELHRLALKNTQKRFPAQLHAMKDVLMKIMDDKGIEPEFFQEEMKDMQKQLPMYVLSNINNYFGAAVIYYPGELKKISMEFASDLLILPSSIHEVIILPFTGDENFEELNSLVQDINISQVAEEEVLSNHIYYYDREKGKLLIPSAVL